MGQNAMVLVINTSLAQSIGLNESIILNQLYYWYRKFPDKWVYNSYQDWKKQFCFWSSRTIQRTFLSLEQRGFIESKRTKKSKFYKLSDTSIKKFFSEERTTKWRDKRANMACSIEYNDEVKNTNKNISPYNPSLPEPDDSREDLRELIKIWNKIILKNENGIILTPIRTKRISQAFCKYFNSNVKQWENFVHTISQSNFLMGKVKDFRVNFDWAIQEPYINRILEGTYNNKITDASVSAEVHKQKISTKVEEMFASVTDETWRSILCEVQEYDGQEGVYSWFRDVKYERLNENNFTIKSESPFCRDYIGVRYLSRIRDAITKTTGIERPIIRIIP